MAPRDIVIVGASLAGMHAAHTLRKEGFDGRIAVVDADTHTPYDRPPLSKQLLAGEWDLDRIILPAVEEDLDIDWHLGERAVGLDVAARTVALGGDRSLTYDALVIAAGCDARRLPDQPDLEGVHVLRTIDDCLALRRDLDAIPRRVVVVGAGFIGSEVAATCRGRGLEVTLVEVAPVPLERALGTEIGLVCADLHRDHGVDVRLGTSIDGFVGSRRVEGVVLGDESVEADVVVVGVGVAPATGWLEGSGLTIDNGVVCDETLAAAPGVVAAGDIARWPSRRFGGLLRIEHWENAIQQGEAAARRVLIDDGAAEPYDPVPWFWSDQYDRKIQLAGQSSSTHTVQVVHGSTDERRFVALYGRDGRVTGVLGFNRPRHVMQLRQLVSDLAPWEDAVAFAEGMG
jgi:3-phenylpropionate/trans-cinnamate dioxygenase ferredoxin reductase subunit